MSAKPNIEKVQTVVKQDSGEILHILTVHA